MDIFTASAKYIGRIDDIVLDPDDGKVTGIAVGKVVGGVLTKLTEKRGVIFPYDLVTAVGDIILIRSFPTLEQTKRFK